MDYDKVALALKELLGQYERISLISHKRADGDTLGSAIALYNILKNRGKKVELCCIDKNLPPQYSFLNGFERFKQRIDYGESLIVTLDCADVSRVGFDIAQRVVVNIDHHKSNTRFGDLNIVDVDVATAAVLYRVIKRDFAICKEAAIAFYTALLSDSQNFTTTLTDARSFCMAQELIELGINPAQVAARVNKHKSLASLRLLSKAIDSLELHRDAKVAFMFLDKETLKAAGGSYSDVEGIVEYALSLATVEIAAIFVELGDIVKVSLRSKEFDISTIALFFGGGGHKNAAGFEVKDAKIREISSATLEKIKEKMEHETR